MNHSSRRFFPNLAGAGLLAFFLSMASVMTTARGNEAAEHQAYLNGGYYLLHHLCDDEAKLPLLVDVKTTPPDIEKFVDRISKTAKESSAALEHIQDGDRHLSFDQNPLPQFERDVRESISDAKQHQLLFGTSDQAFVHALLLTQQESSNYAEHLSKVLAEHEKNPARVKALRHISTEWHAIHEETMRLLWK